MNFLIVIVLILKNLRKEYSSETDEVDLLEVIQSALENDHKFKNAVSKIVGIHVLQGYINLLLKSLYQI